MSHALDDFVRRREESADLLDDLAGLLGPLKLADGPADYLAATARRAREGRFVVLLLGCFSSGKSTLLNALLGQPVLPVKVNPCTAILTEVVYGESPGVTVHYADGTQESLDIDAFTEAFQLRTASEDAAGAEATDRFGAVDRAVVAWPLPLLRNGVVLLDTPGLDDDPIRTARTLSSLPHADAVIFTLSANRFLSDLERRTLQHDLLPLGLRNLFFPVTMVDLLDALSADPGAAWQRMEARARDVLGPLCTVDDTDRFAERFVPLDARGALSSRWDRAAGARRDPVDAEALATSGIEPFEEALERFLVDERGQAQLAHLHGAVRRIHADLQRQAELDRATADRSVAELEARQAELAPRFAQLEVIAQRVERTVDTFIERQQAAVFHDLRAFVADTERALPEAVADFDLGGLGGLDLLTPRGRARVEAQLRDQLRAWLDHRLSQWQLQLRPTLEAALVDLQRELAADADDFDAMSDRILADFAGAALEIPRLSADGQAVDPVERWFSVAMGAVLLSPGTMAAGWAEGYEGALKGAAGRLGVRVAILTLGALLGPIGWAGLVMYLVSDAVLLVLTGGGQLQRLKGQLAKRLEGQLVAQVDAGRDDLSAKVVEGLLPLREGLVQAARAEATELQALLDRTVSTRQQAQADAAARAERWSSILARFDAAEERLAAIATS
jgi:hypothetical protein